MTTSYLDVNAVGGGDGTVGTPWNSLPDAETNKASWDELRIKRGTVENLADYGAESKCTFYSGDSDKTVTTYYNGDGSDDISQPKPVFDHYHTSEAGDWTEVDPTDPTSLSPGSNLWILDGGIASYNPIQAVWFGDDFTPGQYQLEYWTVVTSTLTDVTTNVPAQAFQFDWFRGTAEDNNRLIVYSVGNPVTYYGAVYWSANTKDRVFEAFNSDNIVIENLCFRYTSLGVFNESATDSTTVTGAIVQDCAFNRCGTGIRIAGAEGTSRTMDNAIIRRNTFSDILRGGIWVRGEVRNARIYGNAFTSNGLAVSTGGVYFSKCIPGTGYYNYVYNNTFTDMTYGRFYNGDGGGIETDSQTTNTRIYGNAISRCYQAWHDNSGKENWFYSNLVDDCGMVYFATDATSQDGNNAHIINNTCTNLTVDSTYNDGDQTPKAAIQYSPMTIAGGETKNNILSGLSGSGIRRFDAHSITEDNNCFNGFAVNVIDENDNAESIGSNSISTDPLLGADNKPLVDSPVYEAGVYTDAIKDRNGRPYHIPPTIGAYEFTSGFQPQDRLLR